MAIELPDRCHVYEAVTYDPLTGDFRWRERPPEHFASHTSRNRWNGRFAGTVAGAINPQGYIQITIGYRSYLAHRLAWLLVYGQPVPLEICHIDDNRGNNRIDNLRAATRPQASATGRAHLDNRTGVKGVFLDRNGKFRAHIMNHGQRHHLGYFTTLEAAAAARREAAERLQGEFARH